MEKGKQEIFLEGTKRYIDNFINGDASKIKEGSVVAVKLRNGLWHIGIIQTLILTKGNDYIRITDNFLDKVYFLNDIESFTLLEQKHSENPIVVE